MLVQSTLWEDDWKLGAESIREQFVWRNSGYAPTRTY